MKMSEKTQKILKNYVIGVMSGTSLDGLDIALCTFTQNYNYRIEKAITIPYSAEWKSKLANAHLLSAYEYALLDVRFGHFIGNEISKFLEDISVQVDYIASHGHTIFHQPEHHFTAQIGSGAAIAVAAKHTTVCDFRTTDVALLGQGAPLVPIGDKLLFSDYDFCLNLGGIANISIAEQGTAYDICACNILLNYLAEQVGKSYDKNGDLAQSGQVQEDILIALNELSFFKQKTPKSLGREHIEKDMIPLISSSKHSVADKLATCCRHIALQIATVLPSNLSKETKMLVTGGGAFNGYLMQEIKNQIIENVMSNSNHNAVKVIIPDALTIAFKEALIFAFLGYLRIHRQNNSLCSVTGATKDSCGGAVYFYS